MEANKCALVTGSSNGIGEAIVKRLAKLDYNLVVTGRSASDVARVASECASLSPSSKKPLELVADLSKESDVEELFRCALSHFRGRLDLLVNNAGFGQPVPHTQPRECYDNYVKVMRINLDAAVKLTLLAAPALSQSAREHATGSSSIINIGSISALRPSSSLFAYSTSKAALSSFTSNMAVELAPEIRVNCVAPGPVETKIIERAGFSMDTFKLVTGKVAPLGRIGQPDEVAECVLFLADPLRAGFVTGANLTVDGGVAQAPIRWD